LAGADKEQQNLITQLGTDLGLAFQIKDDLFDIIGGDKTKSLFSDIQDGQQTIFTNYIFEKGSPEDKELLASCMKKSLDEKEIQRLQDMFEYS
jgi:geranylgeranyl pyrophosphate synthase